MNSLSHESDPAWLQPSFWFSLLVGLLGSLLLMALVALLWLGAHSAFAAKLQPAAAAVAKPRVEAAQQTRTGTDPRHRHKPAKSSPWT